MLQKRTDYTLNSCLEDIPVVVLPGCVMRSVITTFDMIITRLAAGERLNRKDVTSMGHGGLCRKCMKIHNKSPVNNTISPYGALIFYTGLFTFLN